MNKTAWFLTFFMTLVLTAQMVVAEVSISLELDRLEATLEDSVTLQVHVSGARNGDAPPTVEGLEGFYVTRGGSASRVEILNGQYHSGVDFTYYLQPKKQGVFQVGPARIEVSGKRYNSNVVTLKVMDGGSANGPKRGPVFLTAKLGEQKTYVERQVPYTLKLFLRANVSDISLDLPETGDLTFRQLEKPKEYQAVYDGVSYRVLEISYGVVPLKAGRFSIPPARMGMTAYSEQKRSPRSLFDDSFFSGAFRTGRPLTVRSEPVSLQVLPFPEKEKPADFSGLVGRFSIEDSLSDSRIHAGDSVTLTVHLKGEGNVNRLPDVKMPALAHLKTYADEPVFETRPGMDGLSGSKTMKWALVPEQAGEYTIPPFSISYFDPQTESYRLKRTKPLVLKVLPGEPQKLVTASQNGKHNNTANHSKQEVKEIGHDILPIYTSTAGLEKGGIGLGPKELLSWLLLIAPCFLYGVVFLVLRLNRKSDQTVYAQRARKAAQLFAKTCRDEKDANAMMIAVRDYVNDRLQLSIGSLTPAEVPKLLIGRGVQDKTAKSLQNVLEELEGRIYAGGEAACGSAGQRILEIVRQVEKELR